MGDWRSAWRSVIARLPRDHTDSTEIFLETNQRTREMDFSHRKIISLQRCYDLLFKNLAGMQL